MRPKLLSSRREFRLRSDIPINHAVVKTSATEKVIK